MRQRRYREPRTLLSSLLSPLTPSIADGDRYLSEHEIRDRSVRARDTPDRSFCIIHTGHPIFIFKRPLLVTMCVLFLTVLFFSLSLSLFFPSMYIIRDACDALYPSGDQPLWRYALPLAIDFCVPSLRRFPSALLLRFLPGRWPVSRRI